tara:strand:+ start:1983 stop:3899 length:1917 start_codon:yes stop_codon:yes gene_type:complete
MVTQISVDRKMVFSFDNERTSNNGNRRWKGNINRAILDASAAFNNLGKVAEEYLTNSLDAFETAVHDNYDKKLKRSDCKIQFIIDRPNNTIVFKDEHELMGMPSKFIFNNFFNIHGTNVSRKRFVNVRGKHGTGKSAAFGIQADYLMLDSVYKGKRTTVKSTYESLQDEDGEPAPLSVIREDVDTNLPNGTIVEIKLPANKYKRYLQFRLETKAIIHIQRVFGRHLNKYHVELIEVTGRGKKAESRITYQPREAVSEKEYPVPAEVAEIIGQTTLIIKRAAEPMEDTGEKGINITSGEYTKEQTMFGLESEPYANHFFGEWEIPKIDQYKGPNPPTLSTRELRLNQENEMVKAIYEFGKKILKEEIKSFAKDERLRKQDETLKKLSHMANELATILNEDFAEFEEISKLEKGMKGEIDKKGQESNSAVSTKLEEDSDSISHLGDEIKVEETEEGALMGSVTSGELPAGAEGSSEKPSGTHVGPLEPKFDESKLKEIKENASRRARRRVRTGGGFRIDFINPGHNLFITRFDEPTKIIFINMDSGIIKAHLKNCGSEEEEPAFKTYAYTLAIDEYARAVVNIMAANHEFSGMSFEEYLQEGVTELGIIKRRVLNRLSQIVDIENINISEQKLLFGSDCP